MRSVHFGQPVYMDLRQTIKSIIADKCMSSGVDGVAFESSCDIVQTALSEPA